MKNFFFVAGTLSLAAFSTAQFVNQDLVIATQSSTGTVGAAFTALNKITGATGFSTGATSFRFGTSTTSGGLKTDNNGSIYAPGLLSTNTAAGRIAKVDMSGATSMAVFGTSAPRGVTIKDNSGTFYVVNNGAALQSGVLNFDGVTTNTLSNDGAQSGSPRLIASHLGVAYSTKGGNNTGSYGVFSGSTSAQVANYGTLPASGGPVDLWLSADGLTMYTAQDGTSAQSGINKWTRASLASNFALVYTLSAKTGTSAEGARYLTAQESTPGVFTLYAATAEATGNRVVKIVDSGAGSTASLLMTASGSNQVRGLAIVPEPASLAIIGVGLAGIAARRRRNK